MKRRTSSSGVGEQRAVIATSDNGKIKQNNGRPRESPEPQPPPINSPLFPTWSFETGFSSFVPNPLAPPKKNG